MIWQEFVFVAGSAFSIFVLAPTLRDSMANVPLGTALPSAVIGIVYGVTWMTMGMYFSAAGALLTGSLWSLIAVLRSPHRFRGRFGIPEPAFTGAQAADDTDTTSGTDVRADSPASADVHAD